MAVDESSTDERRIETWLFDSATREITEMIVSGDGAETVASKTVTGELPQMGFAEVPAAQAIVRSDPGVIAALERRGITDSSRIQVDTWPTGNMGLEHEKGRRVSRCIIFDRADPSHNGYAKPVDGLMAFVDLDEMAVYHIDDFDTWPVPTQLGNYNAGTVPELSLIHI